MLVLVFGDTYISSYNLLIILAVSQSIVLATGPVAYLLMMTDNSSSHRKSLHMAVGINIFLNLILIPSYGITGAAIATGLSLVFKNIYSCIVALKILDKETKIS